MSEEIKEKIKKTNLEKYGIENPNHNKNINRNYSKFHQDVEKILRKNKIKFKSEQRNLFSKFNEELKRNYNPIPDIILTKYKIIIECNGDIWHANPKFYKKNDEIKLYQGLTKAKDIWKRDLIKKKHIESFGYKVIYIWASEFYKNKKIFENEIKNAICKN